MTRDINRFWITSKGFWALKELGDHLDPTVRAILKDLSTTARGLPPGYIAADLGWRAEEDPDATKKMKSLLSLMESEGFVTRDRKAKDLQIVSTMSEPLEGRYSYVIDYPGVCSLSDPHLDLPLEKEVN